MITRSQKKTAVSWLTETPVIVFLAPVMWVFCECRQDAYNWLQAEPPGDGLFFLSSHIHTSFPHYYKTHVQITFLFIDLPCKLNIALKSCKTQCSLLWSHSECRLLWCKIKTSSLVGTARYITFVFSVITNQLIPPAVGLAFREIQRLQGKLRPDQCCKSALTGGVITLFILYFFIYLLKAWK